MTVGNKRFPKLEAEQPVVIKFEDASFKKQQVNKRRPWLLPLLLGAGLGVTISFGGMHILSHRSASQSPPAANKVAPAMTVTVAPVETTRVARTLSATGSVAARDLIPVLPQANNLQIKQILVNEGDFVKAGQVMAVLDNSVLQDQIRQAQADVESKQADVASKQADVESKQADVASKQADVASSQAMVQQKQADLAQAKAKLADAETNFRRNAQLAAQGAISRKELDTTATNLVTAKESVRLGEANVRSAVANVSSATANISTAKAGVKSAQAIINSAQASVRSSVAKVQQLKTQLGQTSVRASVSGVVAEKLARVGDMTGVQPQTQTGTVVGGTQKLFSIIRDGKLELQALLPAIQLSQVKVGALVQITSNADQQVRLQGQVRKIQPLVDDKKRQATVKIDLPTTSLLRPGMFVRAAITTNTTMGVAVPQKAVIPRSDGSAIVFILSGEDEVRAQKVELGEILNGGRVEIKSSLKTGDRVVIDGAGYLTDGDKVRVVNSQG